MVEASSGRSEEEEKWGCRCLQEWARQGLNRLEPAIELARACELLQQLGNFLRKFLAIYWDIWDNFSCSNFVPNAMNFEIKLRFFPKFESKGCWALREFVFTNTNTLVHKPRQGVLQDDVQTFLYDLGNMNRLSHKIEELSNFKRS
jgi:hypothetical protein